MVPVRAKLSKPMAFGSSAQDPTLQVADILAGATADVTRDPGNPAFAAVGPWVARHMHPNHVLPDDEVIDLGKLGLRVNLSVLEELARRADRGLDPLDGMAEV